MTAALLDACVLYPAALRDLWMHLAVRWVFQPKWTPRIQEEWIRNVLKNRPDLKAEQLARTRASMEEWGRDWEVPDYEAWLPGLTLPDPDDCHVLAAALAGGVPLIVTFNLVHFPEATLAPHGVRAGRPDPPGGAQEPPEVEGGLPGDPGARRAEADGAPANHLPGPPLRT